MQVPFDPGMKGWKALSLYRQAIGVEDHVSGRYYANLIRLHERLSGELWSAEAWIEVGKGHLWRNELQAASLAFIQALLIGTSDPDSLYLLGSVQYELGEFEQAEKALSQLVKAKPEHGAAHFMLAQVYRMTGRLGESGEALVMALKADPTNTDAHWQLGNWFRDFGDFEEAVDEYERALEADPEHVASLFNLGCVLVRLGERERVREVRTRLAPLSEHLAAMLDRFAHESRAAGGIHEPDPQAKRHREAAS